MKQMKLPILLMLANIMICLSAIFLLEDDNDKSADLAPSKVNISLPKTDVILNIGGI
ncbi:MULTISPECIES: hypothetical protein [Reichenbachiella]|uniref:hypothetical protein n=1 Tax=Reichenbachiella TaxID=156993 RepID=UPI001314B36E|nr:MULTISPECIES: hypothetical protein [Reichenbachiella]MBU2913230.1 hypothetical protein [Reichenbachiella agariperforans]